MKAIRETWIDYARGIAIILVLYRHVFEGIKGSGIQISEFFYLEQFNIMFFSFRMPLFFIVSGVFVAASLQKRGVQNFISTRARTILYPYFLWGGIQITLQLLFSRYVNNPPEVTDYIYLLYLPREIEQFWYLYALFNVAVLYVFVKVKLRFNDIQNVGLGLFFFYLSAIFHQQVIHLWFLGDILHYYLFYAIGSAIASLLRNPVNRKYLESGRMVLLMFIPFIATQIYFLKRNLMFPEKKFDYVEFYEPLNFLIVALCGCLFIINLAFLLQKLNVAKWLHKLGSYSLYIYVAHVIVLASTRAFMTHWFGIYYVPLLLIAGIITGLVVPVIMYKIAERLNIGWLFSLEKKPVFKPADEHRIV